MSDKMKVRNQVTLDGLMTIGMLENGIFKSIDLL